MSPVQVDTETLYQESLQLFFHGMHNLAISQDIKPMVLFSEVGEANPNVSSPNFARTLQEIPVHRSD